MTKSWQYGVAFAPTRNLRFDFAQTTIDGGALGPLTLRAFDDRVSGLNDDRFGGEELGASGSLAVIEGAGKTTIEAAYRSGLAIQMGLLTFGIQHRIRIDPGLRQLLFPPPPLVPRA